MKAKVSKDKLNNSSVQDLSSDKLNELKCFFRLKKNKLNVGYYSQRRSFYITLLTAIGWA